MTHDDSARTRLMNLPALKALAEQGFFQAVLANADTVTTSSLEEEVLKDCVVAWSLSRLGRQEEAATIAESAYGRAFEGLGEDHPATLTALNDYARFSHRAGRTDVGRAAGEDVFERRVRVLGASHPKTLMSRANLLRYRFECGERVEVSELDSLASDWLRVDPQRHDPAHLSAALLRADVMQSLAAAARADVVAWYVAALGAEHPDTRRASNFSE